MRLKGCLLTEKQQDRWLEFASGSDGPHGGGFNRRQQDHGDLVAKGVVGDSGCRFGIGAPARDRLAHGEARLEPLRRSEFHGLFAGRDRGHGARVRDAIANIAHG